MSTKNAIRRVYWDFVPKQLSKHSVGEVGSLLTIWPGPYITTDACLSTAGFDDFGESDVNLNADVWDAEWKQLVELTLNYFTTFGTPRMRQIVEVEQVQESTFFERILGRKPKTVPVELTLIEQVILVSESDWFQDAIVDFGRDCPVSLSTSNGHRILWVATTDSKSFNHERLLSTASQGRPIHRMELAWEHLIGSPDV